MNFLAHHAVALARRTDGAPEFYVGNVLPDLIAMSGDPRIRSERLSPDNSPLSEGMLLHFASDQRFHALQEFAEAQRAAKALLLSAPFAETPKRIFFLAHVFVEIALDRHILRETPEIVLDFYTRFEKADLNAVVGEVRTLLGTDAHLSALHDVLVRFVRHRYLYDYAESAGCAESLHRICRRAGVFGFPSDAAQATLAKLFDTFAPTIQNLAGSLLGSDQTTQSMVQ